MKRIGWKYWVAGLVIALLPAALLAQKTALPQLRLMPTEFPWTASASNLAGSGMQPGIETIYVAGDGRRNELYSMVFRIAPNTTILPHSHPDNRACFVLSGLWYFGYGKVRNEGQLKALPPGSLYTEPAGQPHFAGTKEQPVTLECTAVGPTGTTMINPADDPRKKDPGKR